MVRFTPVSNAVLDMIVVLVILTIFGMIIIFGRGATSPLIADLNSSSEYGTDMKAILSETDREYPAVFDNGIAMAFMLLVLFQIITTFFVETHPIFFAVNTVLLVCALVALLIIGNVYADVFTGNEFSTYANEFPKLGYLMTHVLEIGIALGFLTLITLFAKRKFFQ